MGIDSTDPSPRRQTGPGPWINEPFAQIIREWRAEVGYSQTEVAGLLGITQGEVSLWERGWIRAPRFHRMEPIAALMGISLDELLASTRWTGGFRDNQPRESLILNLGDDPMADLLDAANRLSMRDLATLVRIARVLVAATP